MAADARWEKKHGAKKGKPTTAKNAKSRRLDSGGEECQLLRLWEQSELGDKRRSHRARPVIESLELPRNAAGFVIRSGRIRDDD
jgi:hypothetical protein